MTREETQEQEFLDSAEAEAQAKAHSAENSSGTHRRCQCGCYLWHLIKLRGKEYALSCVDCENASRPQRQGVHFKE